MEPNTQQVPGYFVWETPGSPVVVHLRLDVVDRLGAEIMRGFGAVPKRGAEVGGLLLGTYIGGDKPVVRVEDFTPVPCEYRRGPSYLLSSDERTSFASAVAAARQKESGAVPVGYYRSHTRDGALALEPEDLQLVDEYFPGAQDIVLMVRPFATKVSVASFLVRDGGAFPAEATNEFPFRRREMTGEEAPARRSMQDRGTRPRRNREEDLSLAAAPPGNYGGPERANEVEYPPPPPDLYSDLPEPRPSKRGWVWVPMCFLFLVIGLALGYQTALTFAPELRDREGAKAFALNLTAGRNSDSLTVRWDRESPAVRAADRGVLEIEDGGVSKPVQLDPAHLKEGTVVYQNTSPMVRFRLVIFLNSRVTVNETVDWTQ